MERALRGGKEGDVVRENKCQSEREGERERLGEKENKGRERD